MSDSVVAIVVWSIGAAAALWGLVVLVHVLSGVATYASLRASDRYKRARETGDLNEGEVCDDGRKKQS